MEQRDGVVTVEGGGVMQARSLVLESEKLHVDAGGTITLNSQGVAAGLGKGTSYSGGGFGGRGGLGRSGVFSTTIRVHK